ncbi:MAG: phosphoglycerate kinase [Patescibacteria group bacterium]
MDLVSLKKAEVVGKTVLVRADLDVPLKKDQEQKNWEVEDDFRIRRALPTIQYLMSRNTKTIVIAHLGRPKERDENFSLLPAASRLAELLNLKFLVIGEDAQKLPQYSLPHLFFFSVDFRKDTTKKLLADLNPGDVAVLENIRFYPEEDQNAADFGKAMAELGEIFVNDAFGSSYNERASITALAPLLPHFSGLELSAEVTALSRVLVRPKRPVVVMVGGIKFSDKIVGLKGLLEICDHAVVGGGLATLFYLAHGYNIGKSKADLASLNDVKDLLRNYRQKIVLPVDVVVARSPDNPDSIRVRAPEKIGPAEMVLDVGPETVKKFSAIIKSANTLAWSGPMGLFEVKSFSHGTLALGRLFASRCRGLAFGVAGGGDTLNAVKLTKMGEYIDYLSTGGSASLDFLGGKKLPGIEVLKKS